MGVHSGAGRDMWICSRAPSPLQVVVGCILCCNVLKLVPRLSENWQVCIEAQTE